MSIGIMVPGRQQLPLDEEIEEHQPTGHFWSPQVACAILLILTDMAAIALSLAIAIVSRIYLLPTLDSDLSLPAFSFWNHATAFGWMWLVLLVFFCVEGLYTQRRSMWNEVGHVVKAIGLGVTAVLAAAALAQLSPGISRGIILLTDRKSTRLNSSHVAISYAVFCLKKKKKRSNRRRPRRALSWRRKRREAGCVSSGWRGWAAAAVGRVRRGSMHGLLTGPGALCRRA